MYKQALSAFFLVPPEVQLLDITRLAYLFYEANTYYAALETHYLSLDQSTEALSSAGISLGQLKPFNSFELIENDILFVPGLESYLFFAEDFAIKSQGFFWLVEKSRASLRFNLSRKLHQTFF